MGTEYSSLQHSQIFFLCICIFQYFLLCNNLSSFPALNALQQPKTPAPAPFDPWCWANKDLFSSVAGCRCAHQGRWVAPDPWSICTDTKMCHGSKPAFLPPTGCLFSLVFCTSFASPHIPTRAATSLPGELHCTIPAEAADRWIPRPGILPPALCLWYSCCYWKQEHVKELQQENDMRLHTHQGCVESHIPTWYSSGKGFQVWPKQVQ